jgi:hypothetical protein
MSAEKQLKVGISTLQHAADYIFSEHILRPGDNQIFANQEDWQAMLTLQQSRQSLSGNWCPCETIRTLLPVKG